MNSLKQFVKKVYRFLGSVYLAIMLIASLAIMVTAGTFLESKTGSHLYASHYTYGNPVFAGLLWLFFINILVSAMHRWPFRVRHIPFLITHFGLLMVIGGVLIKNSFGVQGSMSITEGSSSQEIFLGNTHVIHLEKRAEDASEIITADYPIKDNSPFTLLTSSKPFSEVQLKLLNLYPHSREKFETWIKKDVAVISGFPIIPVVEMKHQLLGAAKKLRTNNKQLELWYLLAFKTVDVADISQEVYVEGTKLIFKNATTYDLMQTTTLKEALASPVALNGIQVATSLHWNYSAENGFQDPYLAFEFRFPEGNQETMQVPLNGERSLQNINVSSQHLGNLSIAVSVARHPTLLFAVDPANDVHYFVYDSFGRVYSQIFHTDAISDLMVYDRGFGGYFVQAKIPFPNFATDNETMEKTALWKLSNRLKNSLEAKAELAPPLELLALACQDANEDFCECCIELLRLWDKSHAWILSDNTLLTPKLRKVLDHLDWSLVPESHLNGTLWATQLFRTMPPNTQDFFNELKEHGWPLPMGIKAKMTSEELGSMLDGLTMQVFSLGDQPFFLQQAEKDHVLLLTTYLRVFGIHLQNIMPAVQPTWEEVREYLVSKGQDIPEFSEVAIETPLTTLHQPEMPLQKMEDNRPLAHLQVSTDQLSERITVAYDRYGINLKWPILNGSYLIRFQSQFQKIPYRIRLRDARQVNYPNSLQPYSYESDVIISNQQGEIVDEATISMNHVYETWDGYRFYLASLSPANENEIQKIQVVVNYDPAKYWLTYPGGIIVTTGIILLFWMRPYRKRM